MNMENMFEYPLPQIQVDTPKITINIADFKIGHINIKNIGGGQLNGKIISNTSCIIFKNKEFSSNDILLEYEAVPSIYTVGDFIKSEIIIISNGGEVLIPVFINITNRAYILCEDIKIYSIKDFYTYFLEKPKEAIKIFTSFDFILWLKKIKFEHLDILEFFLKDSNKLRAIDNFFIIALNKERASFDFIQTSFKFKYFDTSEDNIIGTIPIKMIKKGYFETDIFLQNNREWLELSKTKITSNNFDTNGLFKLDFKIIKSKLKSAFEQDKILFKDFEKSVLIEVYKKQPLEIIFETDFFKPQERASFKIINNLGKELLISIAPKDAFLKFEGENYLVGKYSEIYFEPRLSPIAKAQLDFYKKPYIETKVLIKADINGKIFTFNKKIFVGNSLI